MSGPNQIIKTNRQVIERQVLVELANDHSKVAILCTKEDLELFIEALNVALIFTALGRTPNKWRELKVGLEQLRSEAFQ